MNYCKFCGQEILEGKNYCINCGNFFDDSEILDNYPSPGDGKDSCTFCGKEIIERRKYCPHCGYKFDDSEIKDNQSTPQAEKDIDWDDINFNKKRKQDEEFLRKYGTIPGTEVQKPKQCKATKGQKKQILSMIPPNGRALAFISRSGALLVFSKIFINGVDFTKIKGGQFVYLVMNPGTHVLKTTLRKEKRELKLDLEANKTYFIHIEIVTGRYSPRTFTIRLLEEKRGHKRLAKDTLILHDMEFPISALPEEEDTIKEEETRKNEIRNIKFD